MKNIGFNNEALKLKTREEFIENEKHNGTVEELGAYYDSVVPPKKEEKVKADKPIK